jgi:hypothetical protein
VSKELERPCRLNQLKRLTTNTRLFSLAYTVPKAVPQGKVEVRRHNIMKGRPVAVCVVSLAAVLLGLAAGQQTAQKTGPVVVGIVGQWVQSSDPKAEPIKFLNTLNGEGSCVFGKSGYLAVQLGDKVVPLQCDKLPDDRKSDPCDARRGPYMCGRTVRIPDKGNTFGAALLAAVSPLIHRDSERYVAPVSRGLDPELGDAVVSLKGNAVDLTLPLADLTDGRYALQWELLSTDRPRVNIKANISWKEGGSGLTTVPGLNPGLYRVTRVANGAPTGQDAWVLVSPADHFEKLSGDYKHAVEETKQWPDEVDARAPRAVLRAYLQALSAQVHPVKVETDKE